MRVTLHPSVVRSSQRIATPSQADSGNHKIRTVSLLARVSSNDLVVGAVLASSRETREVSRHAQDSLYVAQTPDRPPPIPYYVAAV